MRKKNFILVFQSLLFVTFLFLSSCDKIDSIQDIDHSNKFSLDEVGDGALVKYDDQYLFLMLESRGPEACAKVKWWYQEGEKETFNFDQADSGIVDLFEKWESIRKEDDREYFKDDGSQLFIQVKGMHVEWSANRFFYLPENYTYTLFNKDEETKILSLKNIQWEKGDGVKKTTISPEELKYSPIQDIESLEPYGGIEPDIGKSLHKEGRPAEWNPTSMSLGSTGFTASAGPYMYTDEDNQDWDYYSIDVERPIGNSSYVFFERDMNINDIPAEIINKRVEDIVKFDENSGVVTFILGDQTYAYKLPDI